MKKILILLFFSFSCCAMQYNFDELFAFKSQEDLNRKYTHEQQQQLCKRLIEDYKKELSNIIKPGLSSLLAVYFTDNKFDCVLNNLKEQAKLVAGGNRAIVNYCQDNKTKILDLSDLNKINIKDLQENNCKLISISPCGKFAATVDAASSDDKNIIKLWDIRDFDNIFSVTLDFFEGIPSSISVNSNQEILVCNSTTVKKWSPSNITITQLANIDSPIISQNGAFAVGLSHNQTGFQHLLLKKDLDAKGQLGSLFVHGMGPLLRYKCIALSPCNKYLYMVLNDGKLCCTWANLEDFVANNKVCETIANLQNKSIDSIAVSPCGKYIFLGSKNKIVIFEVIDWTNNKQLEHRLYLGQIAMPDFPPDSVKSIVGSSNFVMFILGSNLLISNFSKIECANSIGLYPLLTLIRLIKSKYKGAGPLIEAINCYRILKGHISPAAHRFIKLYILRKYLEQNTGLINSLGEIISDYTSELNLGNCCAQCSKEDCKLRCSACKKVYYCSPECHQAHWETHKKECKKYAQKNNNF